MELDLKDYLKIIKKRLWLLLAIVFISSLTAGIVSFYILTPVYQASTKLIVNKPQEKNGTDGLTISDVNLNIQIINTYKEVIKTPYIMELVAKEYPQFALTPEQLIGKVQVSSVNNTQVMTLVVEDPSYQKAVDIVNAVSKVFQREIPKVMKVDNVSILSEAKSVSEPAPVKPNKLLNVVIGFVVSFMVGLGIIFLMEYMDDTLKTESDVEKVLGLPTLTMITKMKAEDIAEATAEGTRKEKVGENQHVNVTLNQ